jgi:hypothetical protein
MPKTTIQYTAAAVGAHGQDATVSGATSIAVPDGASHMLIQAQTQNVRFTLDGTAPTTTKGFLVPAGTDPLLVPVPAGGTVKVIETAASATVDYQFLTL